jgi:hypothetical protein
MVELARDGLHRRIVKTVRLQHHGEGIAGKAPAGEHIEREETAAHSDLLSQTISRAYFTMPQPNPIKPVNGLNDPA